jgi:hypothetical protein
MASSFYDEGALRHAAINLFHGWGYNFYRQENQLRADDQLVRSKAEWFLGVAVSNVETAEAGYRREFFAAPTRAKPFPDAAVVAVAQTLERLARDINALKGRIQAQPVPESDRMTQRYRSEADTLQTLIGCDEQLVGQCALLHSLLDGRNGTEILDMLASVTEGLIAIQSTLRKRENVLQDSAGQ